MDAKANGSMPVSPVECQWRRDGSVAHGVQTGSTTGLATGLTKREAFAMAAMQGMLANTAIFDGAPSGAEWVATESLRQADALLQALTPTQERDDG